MAQNRLCREVIARELLTGAHAPNHALSEHMRDPSCRLIHVVRPNTRDEVD